MDTVKKIGLVIIILFALNLVSNKLFFQADLTSDKRYTLSNTTKTICENLKKDIQIKIYLDGKFPAEFKRLQLETIQHIKQLQNYTNHIHYRLVNPSGMEKELMQNGLQPSRLTVQEGVSSSEVIIFPWATVRYKDKTIAINLLEQYGANSQEEQMQSAIENLEYAFSDAIHKITNTKRKNIAVLTDNKELDFIYLDGLLHTVSKYYHLEPFPLDSANVMPTKTLDLLNKFDLAIVAKPRKSFTENQKYVLDQFQLNNKKSIWLIDNVIAEQDSLMQTGNMLALNRDLNITDLLFSYGVRVNYNLVKDLYSSTIKLANGQIGNQAQYKDYLWPYFPFVQSKNNHAINKNIKPISLKYVSSLDTLKSAGVKKTILLQSSPLSKPFGVPLEIRLDEVAQKPLPEQYNNGNKFLSVLLEGKFKSAYKNRTKPFDIKNPLDKSENSKMIVVSDGDIIKNQVHQGKPLDLGVDKWTGQLNGNKDFLLNSINYLLDDNGLVNLRAKKLQLKFLDKEKVYKEMNYWKYVNLILPLMILFIFGFIYFFLRKRSVK